MHSSTALRRFFGICLLPKYLEDQIILWPLQHQKMCIMFGSLKLQYLLWFWLLHFAKPLALFLALLLTAVAIVSLKAP